jgi:outer membrane protein TolC
MTPHPFDRQIEVAGRRLEALQQRAGESSGQGALTLETLQELSTALEELHVASEELRHQNEELAASREVIEAERRRYQDLFEFAPGG